MKKRLVDLTPTELAALAGDAWKASADKALANGLPVTGSRDGRRIKYFPDGHIEDLGPVADILHVENKLPAKKPGKSVA